MSDERGKPVGVAVMSLKTGTRETLQPVRRQEAKASVSLAPIGDEEVLASSAPGSEASFGGTDEVALEQSSRPKAKDKEPQKIEGLADFLTQFYAGKTKTLGGTTLRKLARNSQIDVSRRYELLALAEDNDPTLEKSLNLMLLAADLSGYRGVEEQLRYFAADIGRRVQGPGKLTLESWMPRATDDGLTLEAMAGDVLDAVQKVSASELPVAEKKKAHKRLECGFYLACQWRLYQGAALRELIHVLRRSVFAPNPLHRERGDGLIRMLASQPFTDAPGLSWLLDDQARLVQQAGDRADQLEREMRQLEAAHRDANEKLKAREAEIAEKDAQLKELQAQLHAALESSRVQEVHSNDDLSRLRAQVLRVLNSELPILLDVQTALNREPPKVGVARECLGGVVEKLSKEISRIKER